MSSTPSRPRRRSPVLLVGAVLLLLGLSGLGYAYLGTNLLAGRAFDSTARDLRQHWQQAGPSPPARPDGAGPPEERATALLRIPAFGSDHEIPVLEGTALATLTEGVGHYPGTAEPGQVGNFAVAGHRVTHGQPFRRLLELDAGDSVVVETAAAIHTYVIDVPPRSLTVPDTATWVLDPVPGEPEVEPTRALITLTTAQDLLRSADRSVGFGHLQSTTNK